MNRFMEQKWAMWEGTHGMRSEILDTLTDADLAFNPGGKNMTFGALWREMGEVEYDYIQSLKTFKLDFTYRNTEAGLETSVASLKAWFAKLDDEMKTILSALSEDEMQKNVMRASGYEAPMDFQMDAYLQAILIFFGKTSVYLKLMNKPLTNAMRDWIW